jgi:hypothetical protein
MFLATTGDKMQEDWVYEEISVCDVQHLLSDYEIEVESPDGWVEVTDFVDKGLHEEYILTSIKGNVVRVSNKHLFETNNGWFFAENMVNKKTLVLHDDGNYYECQVTKTGKFIPIVDISVKHDNHRYYTNGISSHNTGSGKSLVKCHMAAASLLFGKNVLYITMELAEEEVSRRIDANILDITLDEVKSLPLDAYTKKIERFKSKTTGKLIVKEYPTGSAHSGHFRHLINELKLKKSFKPDIIFVDYLNICASARVRGANAGNSYTLIKSIAEEIRGLAMEFDVPIVSSSQLNRSGYENTDVDLTNTSECIFVDEKVVEKTKGVMRIADLSPGDVIKSNDETKIVTMVHHPKPKQCVRITTKSGKKIIVSKGHVFPTKTATGEVKRISVSGGLEKGFFISSIGSE